MYQYIKVKQKIFFKQEIKQIIAYVSINPAFMSWFWDFVTNRTQQLKLNGSQRPNMLVTPTLDSMAKKVRVCCLLFGPSVYHDKMENTINYLILIVSKTKEMVPDPKAHMHLWKY